MSLKSIAHLVVILVLGTLHAIADDQMPDEISSGIELGSNGSQSIWLRLGDSDQLTSKIKIGFHESYTDPSLDQFEMIMIRKAYLSALGARRDRDQGEAVAIHLFGGLLPIRHLGHTHSRTWAIGRVGLDFDYAVLDAKFNARDNGHGLKTTGSLQLDGQISLDRNDRVQLRVFEKLFYSALVGDLENRAGADYAHTLGLLSRAGLYIDVMPSAPVRKIYRTNVFTNKREYVIRKNPGKRLRLILAEAGLRWQPVDHLTDDQLELQFVSGLEYND